MTQKTDYRSPRLIQEYLILAALHDSETARNLDGLVNTMRDVAQKGDAADVNFIFGPVALLQKLENLRNSSDIVGHSELRISETGRLSYEVLRDHLRR